MIGRKELLREIDRLLEDDDDFLYTADLSPEKTTTPKLNETKSEHTGQPNQYITHNRRLSPVLDSEGDRRFTTTPLQQLRVFIDHVDFAPGCAVETSYTIGFRYNQFSLQLLAPKQPTSLQSLIQLNITQHSVQRNPKSQGQVNAGIQKAQHQAVERKDVEPQGGEVDGCRVVFNEGVSCVSEAEDESEIWFGLFLDDGKTWSLAASALVDCKGRDKWMGIQKMYDSLGSIVCTLTLSIQLIPHPPNTPSTDDDESSISESETALDEYNIRSAKVEEQYNARTQREIGEIVDCGRGLDKKDNMIQYTLSECESCLDGLSSTSDDSSCVPESDVSYQSNQEQSLQAKKSPKKYKIQYSNPMPLYFYNTVQYNTTKENAGPLNIKSQNKRNKVDGKMKKLVIRKTRSQKLQESFVKNKY